MATSTIKGQLLTKLGEGSSSTEYNLTIPDISAYEWLIFSYATSNIVTLPTRVFKSLGYCNVLLPNVSNSENYKATFQYISDTSIKVTTSQGSMIRIFGFNN